MAFSITPLLVDVRALVGTAWPDVVVNGIWDAERVSGVEWIDLDFPFAVILCPSLQRAEYGVNSLAFTADLQVYYVGITSGPADTMRARCEALADAAWPSDDAIIQNGQIIDILGMQWDDGLEVNRILRESNRQQRAGMVTLRCLVSFNAI